MLLRLSQHCECRPLPDGAAVFNSLTNTTQLISQPHSDILIRLAQARDAGESVNKSDIMTMDNCELTEEFIEQALVLRIIEKATPTP
ncbi:hypothetical protein [Lacimicrobium sp. SS2-24]|uniref:hypothetical protein n=1 Tax=Lacimicrobium sp. SS2-24 TaxID=2005569 RepID=UPI000B4BF3C0|nr:hypothetical protein [Lacimicrobium sp. SS2-24]